MQRSSQRFASFTVISLAASLLLAACGGGSNTSTVTLKYLNWNKSDVGSQFAQVVSQFEAANPNIKITVENVETAQYEQVLQTRFAGGDAPDIIASHGGPTYQQEVKAGDFLDLSDQSFVANQLASSKAFASISGKDYGFVASTSVAGVIYNKQLFTQLGLAIPRTWDDFLADAAKIKAAGITPLAVGYKDLWPTQLIPYEMGTTAIFRDDLTFNQELASGQKTFANSPAWRGMLQDTEALSKSGYFNEGPNGTTYNQAVQLMATSKAAMMIMGNWAISNIQQGNPSIQLGMFTLPYKQGPYFVATSPAQIVGISAKTKHATEAKKFLDFWSSTTTLTSYLNGIKAVPAVSNVQSSDPTYNDILADTKNGTHVFLNNDWPTGVDTVLMNGMQGLIDGSATVDQILQKMDAAYQSNKATLPTQ